MKKDRGIDIAKIKNELLQLFQERKADFNTFGNTVNQVFEAFVYASVVRWHESHNWSVKLVNPARQTGKPISQGPPKMRLKFSTRGRPENYSYVICEKESQKLQIRHQLRVCTFKHRDSQKYSANICLDVAVIHDIDLSGYNSDKPVPNNVLVTFGEAKHMSAYAELVAAFIGMTHELQPQRLRRVRKKSWCRQELSPFLYVSGFMFRTALGIEETIKRRLFDIDIYTRVQSLVHDFQLPPRV